MKALLFGLGIGTAIFTLCYIANLKLFNNLDLSLEGELA